jgi:hypothetical protein
MSFAVLWQHVFQIVLCVLSAVQSHTQQPETHWLILQKYNFSKDQRRLPEDRPGGPKHVGAKCIDILIVNFNISYV